MNFNCKACQIAHPGSGALTIGSWIGNLPGPAKYSQVHVRSVGCRMDGADFHQATAITVEYGGSEASVEREAIPCD